ncbi:hypothetical protein VTK26DRAFT_4541 [Humicola hyalothermophila]
MADNEFILFSLAPRRSRAEDIVKINTRKYGTMVFRAAHRSKTKGCFLTMGSDGNCDILLPQDCSSVHCVFYLLETGELVVEDRTSSHSVELNWCESLEDLPKAKYRLQGSPRHRVIPLAQPPPGGGIFLSLKRDIVFEFAWRFSTRDPEYVDEVRRRLAKIVRSNIKEGLGQPPRFRPSRDRECPGGIRERLSEYTPIVPGEESMESRIKREIHHYRKLGKGCYGTVFKAVDLETGKLWAVKTCRNPDGSVFPGDSWKSVLKNEVEKLGKLTHKHIIRFDYHQGWSPESEVVEIFLPLCDGDLYKILQRYSHQHNCHAPQKGRRSLWPRFTPVLIDQVLSALAFLQEQGIVHLDIKPDNILYTVDQLSEDQESSMTFYLSDFGYTGYAHEAAPKGSHGYMAPEISENSYVSTYSDLYSFGVTLLEVMGIYCTDYEMDSRFDWRKKLRNYGVKGWETYTDLEPRPDAVFPDEIYGQSRIQSLFTYKLIPSVLKSLLAFDRGKRKDARTARILLLEEFSTEGKGHQNDQPSASGTQTPAGQATKARANPRDQDTAQGHYRPQGTAQGYSKPKYDRSPDNAQQCYGQQRTARGYTEHEYDRSQDHGPQRAAPQYYEQQGTAQWYPEQTYDGSLYTAQQYYGPQYSGAQNIEVLSTGGVETVVVNLPYRGGKKPKKKR